MSSEKPEQNAVPQDGATERHTGEKLGQQSSPAGAAPEAATDADGYAVKQSDGHYVGVWKHRDLAEKIVNRSPSIKGEVIVEIYEAATIAALRSELAACREDAERYRWLCDDLSTEEQRDERHRLCMRMGVMGKGAIDAAIKARKV